MKNLIIYSCLFASLSACSIKEEPLVIKKVIAPKIEIKVVAPKIEIIGHKVKECDSTQRDLSIPWSLRQYWCSDKNKVKSLQNINNDLLEIVITNEEYLNEVNDEVEKKQFKYHKAIKQPNQGQKALKHNLKKLNIASVNQKNSLLIHNIIFAKNIKVLGPQGRKSTLELLLKVNSSKKVYLRGLILPEEVLVDSKIYKEMVSVGRALAVRNLWVKNGVDVTKIKILHHNSDLIGRSVAVYFNG